MPTVIIPNIASKGILHTAGSLFSVEYIGCSPMTAGGLLADILASRIVFTLMIDKPITAGGLPADIVAGRELKNAGSRNLYARY